VRVGLLLAFGVLAYAQDGADVFARTCANSYCHGPKGAGGGAPKLASRGFDEVYIASVTRAGVPGTAMQGYGSSLPRASLNAVVAYVASLNGIEAHIAPSEPAITLSTDALRGRDSFFDAVRGADRCATCHQVQGMGIAIAAITKIPANAAAMRNISTPDVKTTRLGADHFPTIVISEGGRRTVLYDLTTLPPVLRTVDASSIGIADYSAWMHSTVIKSYSDSELASILVFLREVVRPKR
jgi:mono/diheme cytochrome c family protein